MATQLHPYQVKGLNKAYEDLEKLSKNTLGIKIAVWVTAISTLVLAIVGVATLTILLLNR